MGALVKPVGYFNNNVIFNIEIWVAEPGEDYVVVYRGLPKLGTDSDEYTTLKGAQNQLHQMKTVICDSSDFSFRDRYDRVLAGNRRALEGVSPEH